jgi:hypothetical protein
MFMRHTNSTVHLNAALAIKRLTSYESMLSIAEPVLIELRDELSSMLHNTFNNKVINSITGKIREVETFK